MKNSLKSSGLTPTRSRPMKPSIWSVSSQLTPSEIVSLRQSKKLIADYVQKELPERLKERHLEHLLT